MNVPRFGRRRPDAFRRAQLAPVRSATGPHLIKTVDTASGKVRAECACGWKAKTVRPDHRIALADAARHVGKAARS